MEARMIDVGEVRLHVVTAAPAKEAPAAGPVVLLHGFPSFWQTWKHQIGVLAAAGHHVIVPDMRGYNLSEKPRAVGAYTAERLAGDVVGLIHALGYERAVVVGHDWGAVAAWQVAMRYPEAVERLVVMNVTHPTITRRKLFTPQRMLKWWYMFFFQLPWLPEMLLRQPRRMASALKRLCANREAFTREDIQAHIDAFRQPGAATATINYYRAAFRHPSPMSAARAYVQVPTLLLWGDEDPILGEDLLEGLDALGKDIRVRRMPAGHWLPQEMPDEVSQAILAFAGEAATSRS